MIQAVWLGDLCPIQEAMTQIVSAMLHQTTMLCITIQISSTLHQSKLMVLLWMILILIVQFLNGLYRPLGNVGDFEPRVNLNNQLSSFACLFA